MAATPDIAKLTLPGISIAHCRLPAWEAGDYVSVSAACSVGISFTSQACNVDVGGRWLDREVSARSVVVTGPEAPTWLRVSQASDLVEVSADVALRSSIADEYSVPASTDLGDLSIAEDPVIWAVGCRLRSLVRASAPSELEIETLVRRFYARVFELRFGGRIRAKGDGGLDGRRLARVIEFIDAHIDERLSLSTLADIAALSPFHFHRSFRRTVGCSPHHYVALRKRDRPKS